jgi:hypothetical protein
MSTTYTTTRSVKQRAESRERGAESGEKIADSTQLAVDWEERRSRQQVAGNRQTRAEENTQAQYMGQDRR